MSSITLVETEIIQKLQYYVSMNEKITLAQLADECHVAQSTIVKLAKKMGYTGFVEMYFNMRVPTHKAQESLAFYHDLIDGDINSIMKSLCAKLNEFKDYKNIIYSLGDADLLCGYISRKFTMFDFYAPGTYDYAIIQNSSRKRGFMLLLCYMEEKQIYLQRAIEMAKKEGYYLIAFVNGKNEWIERQVDFSVIIKQTNYKKADFFTAKAIMFTEVLLSSYSMLYHGQSEVAQ